MLYHAERDHCSKILKKMNSLRNEESCHDVCLIVGEKKLHAHKWVLVAVSDYFKSVFTGPLGDQSTAEIDLSPITSDSDALELVLNYIYSGEIDINLEHIGSILKIADYFLLDELKGFCRKFLLNNLTVKNCMMSYLLAIDFSFPEVEKNVELKLRSRMHDFLIFEKSSLEILPEQLLYLVNHDFFEHCAVTSIMCFVKDWVIKGNSEKHEALGVEMLDKLCPEELPPCSNDKSRSDVIKTLKDLSFNKENDVSFTTEFSAKLNSIVSQYTSQIDIEVDSEQTPGESSNLEQILMTLTPTDKGIEMAGKQIYPHTMGVPLLDICVYVPRTNTWHHVQTVLAKRDSFSELSAEDENWTYMCLFDKIVVLWPMSSKVEEYSLRDFEWKTRELDETILPRGKVYDRFKKLSRTLFNKAISGGKAESYDEETYIEVGYRYCSGSAGIFSVGQTICLLLKMRVNQPGEDPDNPCTHISHNQAFFKCYQLDSDDKWSFWFDTPKFETDELRMGCCRAVLSNDNKEMLIVHHDSKKFHVFLGDMAAEGGIKVVSATPDKSDELKTSLTVTDFHIIRGDDAFYVLAVTEQKECPAKVVCKYKYSFSSKSFSVCEDSESKVLTVDDGGIKYGRGYPPTLQYRFSECDGSSLWLFGGNTYDESFLKEVTVQTDGSLQIQSHSPPPFSRITQAVTGYMDVDCLAAFEPQKTYLTGIDMNTFERHPYNLLGGGAHEEENDCSEERNHGSEEERDGSEEETDDSDDEYGQFDEYEEYSVNWRSYSEEEDDDYDEFFQTYMCL